MEMFSNTGLLRLIPRSELISKEKFLENSGLIVNNNKMNGQNNNGHNPHYDNLNLLKNLIMNNNVEEGGNTEENRKQFLSQFSNEHKFILSQFEQFQKNNNFSLHAQSQHIHQMLTNNNKGNGGMNENHNFLAPNTERSSALAVKRRIRRRATSSSDPTESLTEMSVRGLNLFRYASVTEGIYKCMECAKVDVIKTFKNKYSFQRHAFLYHEGCQRKVFPCPVCGKEFSRPDKMKNHMKTVHDCFMPATTPQGQRGQRASPVIDFHKDSVFNKDIVHNLSIFATNNNAGKKRPFPHRRDVSVSKRKHHQTLSKSITYDLNPDVSLTRGIIYAEHSGDECEIIPVAKRVNAGRPMRRSKRVRLANAEDSDIMAADVVECEAEDVLRSLTKLTPGALESNGYCEETGVFGSGVHFLTSESLLSFIQATDTDTSNSSSTFPSPNFPSTNLSTNFPSSGEDDVLTRKDLLEYLMNSDGTCACKLCGEVLTSRTHWYRHKYKVHTPAHLAPPVSESKLPDLHSCAECKQYFKSKKGYLGHLQAKHNIDCDETTHAQTDTPSSESSTQALNTISVGDTRETRIGESRSSGIVGQTRMSSILVEKDYAKQRELEEKLVKDIIDKVKRECEAQGDNAMSRKGYTKKMRK
ncbi:hypothetical protein M8J77_007749 [Diaphorina citri]|nr:hypothetical protein M8J77_007749 [Diaphorina citri]